MTLRRVNRSPSRPSIRALLRRPLHPFRSSAPRSERGGPTGPAKPATRGVHLAVHPSSNLRFGPEHRASNRRSNLRPRTLALLLPPFHRGWRWQFLHGIGPQARNLFTAVRLGTSHVQRLKNVPRANTEAKAVATWVGQQRSLQYPQAPAKMETSQVISSSFCLANETPLLRHIFTHESSTCSAVLLLLGGGIEE